MLSESFKRHDMRDVAVSALPSTAVIVFDVWCISHERCTISVLSQKITLIPPSAEIALLITDIFSTFSELICISFFYSCLEI